MLTRTQLLLTSSPINSSKFRFAMKSRSPISFNKQSVMDSVFSLCRCPTVNSIFSNRLSHNARSLFRVKMPLMRIELSVLKAHLVLWLRLLTITLTTRLLVKTIWSAFCQRCLSLLGIMSLWPATVSWSNNSWTMDLTFITLRCLIPQSKLSSVSDTTMATRRSWHHSLRNCWLKCNYEQRRSIVSWD